MFKRKKDYIRVSLTEEETKKLQDNNRVEIERKDKRYIITYEANRYHMYEHFKQFMIDFAYDINVEE